MFIFKEVSIGFIAGEVIREDLYILISGNSNSIPIQFRK